MTPADGAVVHGALITALASTKVTDVNPVLSRPTVDLAAHEPEIVAENVAFPATLQRVRDYAAPDGRHTRLNLAAGQFVADPADPAGRGTQELFTQIAADVLRSRSTDFDPPRITRVDTAAGGGRVTFDATTPDSDVTSGVALYEDAAGVWHRLDLTISGGHARGFGPLPGDAESAGVSIVQLVDAAGNVGVETDKGSGHALAPLAEAGADAPPLVADPPPGPDGMTQPPVTVDIAGDARSTASISVDGSGYVAYSGPIVLTAPGVHVVTARAPDGSTSRQTVIISDEVPIPTLASTSPVSPSTDDHPRVSGTAPGAAQVMLYAGSDCSGVPIGEGSAAQFEGAGIPVTVARNATTTLRAVAVGVLGSRTACSTSALTYVNDVAPPDTRENPPRSGLLLGTTYTGTATDNLSGVARVEVALDALFGSQTLVAKLTCDASRRSCQWSQKLPLLGSVLARIQVTAIDAVGLRDPSPVVRRTPR